MGDMLIAAAPNWLVRSRSHIVRKEHRWKRGDRYSFTLVARLSKLDATAINRATSTDTKMACAFIRLSV